MSWRVTRGCPFDGRTISTWDASFRPGRAAQAIGNIAPYGAAAVPALVTMLQSTGEGLRNSACIELRGIGPAAKDALPALERALSDDPSKDVRPFAQLAIASINSHQER
jgi:hypothetical protein